MEARSPINEQLYSSHSLMPHQSARLYISLTTADHDAEFTSKIPTKKNKNKKKTAICICMSSP